MAPNTDYIYLASYYRHFTSMVPNLEVMTVLGVSCGLKLSGPKIIKGII